MAYPVARHRNLRLVGQAVIVVLTLVLVAAPPATGRLLLVPLDGRPAARTFAMALDHHMTPLAAGPLPGSFIVLATRDGAVPDMLRSGVLPLPAFAAGCVGRRTA